MSVEKSISTGNGIEPISVGSLSPTINWKTMAAQEFVLPPLAEQNRFAEMLTAQDCVIEAKQEALLALEKCLKSTRAQILSEGLLGNIDEATGLPVGWAREPLGNLVEFSITSVCQSKRLTDPSVGGGIHITVLRE